MGQMTCSGQCGPFGPLLHFLCDILCPHPVPLLSPPNAPVHVLGRWQGTVYNTGRELLQNSFK